MRAAAATLAILLVGCASREAPATLSADEPSRAFPWEVSGVWWNRTEPGDFAAGIVIDGGTEPANYSMSGGAAGVTQQVGVVRLLFEVKEGNLVHYGRYGNLPDPYVSVSGVGAPARKDVAYEAVAQGTMEKARLGLHEVVLLAHDTVPGTDQLAALSSSISIVSSGTFNVTGAWIGHSLLQFNQWTFPASSGAFSTEANVVQGSTTIELANPGEIVLFSERGDTTYGGIHITGPGLDLEWVPTTGGFYRARIDPGAYTVTADWAGTALFFGFVYEIAELSSPEFAGLAVATR